MENKTAAYLPVIERFLSEAVSGEDVVSEAMR